MLTSLGRLVYRWFFGATLISTYDIVLVAVTAFIRCFVATEFVRLGIASLYHRLASFIKVRLLYWKPDSRFLLEFRDAFVHIFFFLIIEQSSILVNRTKVFCTPLRSFVTLSHLSLEFVSIIAINILFNACGCGEIRSGY